MELLNATPMKAGFTTGLRPDGTEVVVVAVRGTFRVANGAVAELADEQLDLVLADEFSGEPGLSATLREADFPLLKPRCDVLLNGSAYAPRGGRASRVRVQLELGKLRKAFDVVGNRKWHRFLFFTFPGRPAAFRSLPVSYDVAFGGSDVGHPNPKQARAYLKNHVGLGYHSRRTAGGKPLPNTEQPGKAIRNRRGGYRPMAFGALGRAWLPRSKYAGTYDKAWLENVMPFLPEDFDERYYQSAPEDQQIDYPKGGEKVQLTNLTPEGRTSFRLPAVELPVTFYYRSGEEKLVDAVVDTILIEPDASRVTLVWRASVPLRRNIFELGRVVAGTMPDGWHRARRMGKKWYRSLRALVAARPMKPVPRRIEGRPETVAEPS